MIETAADPGQSRYLRRGFFTRLLWAGVLSGASTVALVYTLAARVPNILDTPLVAAEAGWEPKVVRLIETGGPAPPVYVIWLRPGDLFAVVQHPEIRILFATDGARVRLRNAMLEVMGTPCVYHTPAAARLQNNAMLAFIRGVECSPLRGVPTGELKLTVELDSRAPVAVWTFQRPPNVKASNSGEIEVVGLHGRAGPFPVLRGAYVDHLSETGATRIDLLSYMWASRSASWIWYTVAVCCLLLFAGLYLIATSTALGGPFGAACLAAAAALLWAVLMPPLQAADEPDHLLSFAKLVEADINSEVRLLARRSHLLRIAFSGNERFRPVDRDRPYTWEWVGEVEASDTAGRSPVTAQFWRAASHSLNLAGRRPFEILVRLRVLNALIFAVAVGLSAIIAQYVRGVSQSPMSLMGLAVIPTLPYFATMVSEWALFTSLSVLWATAVLVMWDDGPDAAKGGLLVGGSFGLLAATSLAALPLAPLMGALLVGRVFLGSRNDHPGRSAAIFWAGVTLGLTMGYLFTADVYRVGYFRGDARSGTGLELMTIVNRWLASLAAQPWLILGLLAAGALTETLMRRIDFPEAARRVVWKGAASMAILMASAAVAILLTSAFVTLPTLPLVNARTFTSSFQYVQAVMLALATSFRLSSFDHLVYTSFWSGFGWLDTILPDALLAGFAAACVSALVLLTIRLITDGDGRRLGWFIFVLAGAAASACACAVATYALGRNLHGRYFIGLYLPMLIILWQGVAQALGNAPAAPWKRLVEPGLVTGLMAVHTYSFVFVLKRFF